MLIHSPATTLVTPEDEATEPYFEYFSGTITLITKKGVWIQFHEDNAHLKYPCKKASYYDEWMFVEEKPETQDED